MREIYEDILRHFPERRFSASIRTVVRRLLRLKGLHGSRHRGRTFVSLTDSGFELAMTAYDERFSLGFVDPCRIALTTDQPSQEQAENIA